MSTTKNLRKFAASSLWRPVAVAGMHVQLANAHGYAREPPSRVYACRSYKQGTRVLQPKTGEVFECKPFPFEGWCKSYSGGANQYEPGVGSNWQDAWIKR
jgi:chitin-binding protein